MRIYLRLSAGTEAIPFNYQPFLTGAFHKWLGKENAAHGEASLYSFSWLQNVGITKDGIRIKDGSYFFISAYNEALIKNLIRGIQNQPEVCFGAMVTEVQLQESPDFSTEERFMAASPIFIKRKIDGSEKHFLYNDPDADKLLTETLQTKLKIAGIPEDGVSVSFDHTFHSPQVKLLSYRGINNKASLCPVIVKGTPEQIAFAWHVGAGNSTGIGFGALK